MRKTFDQARSGNLWLAAAAAAFLGLLPTGSSARSDDAPFIRGDVNQDGFVSLSDSIYLRRWLFWLSVAQPTCLDAADFTDEGMTDITDVAAIIEGLVMVPDWSYLPPAPFLEPGADPTADCQPGLLPPGYHRPVPSQECFWDDIGCESYSIVPAQVTEDVVRIGDVEGQPGQEVEVPIFVTTSVPIDAFQLVIAYDPELLSVRSGGDTLTYRDSYYQGFIGKTFEVEGPSEGESRMYTFGEKPFISQVRAHPGEGIFTVGIVADLVQSEFTVEPGTEILIARIRATISPAAPPGAVTELDPTNGPDGEGIGPYRMRNELTHRGEARYLSIIPRTIPGQVGAVVGDITFFRRGDANRDRTVDISDAVYLLAYLFTGGEPPACQDAADADDSGELNVTDPIVVLAYLFTDGKPLPGPFPEAGIDVTQDSLEACR